MLEELSRRSGAWTAAGAVGAALLIALALGGAIIGCQGKPKSKTGASGAQPSATAAASAPSPSTTAPRPPADAKALASGGQWQLVRQGSPAGPQPPFRARLNVVIWDAAGKQLFSSYSRKNGSVAVDLESFSPALLEMIRLTGVGGVARAWIPAGAAGDWKPRAMPDEDLTYEVEILGSVEPSQGLIYTPDEAPGINGVGAAGAVPRPAAPDSAEPPRDALRTRSGLWYRILQPGDAQKAGPRARAGLSIDAWAARGLTIEPVITRQSISLTVEKAPAGLGEVLQRLGSGGRARIWAPPEKSRQMVPSAKNEPLVIDVTLLSAQSD